MKLVSYSAVFFFIEIIGLLLMCGCIADNPDNGFTRDSTSKWYNDADEFENSGFGFGFN